MLKFKKFSQNVAISLKNLVIILTMSKKDQVKYDLDILKGFLFACVGGVFGIVGYAVMSVESLTRKQIILGSVVTFILFIALAIVFRGIKINRKKLRELE